MQLSLLVSWNFQEEKVDERCGISILSMLIAENVQNLLKIVSVENENKQKDCVFLLNIS